MSDQPDPTGALDGFLAAAVNLAQAVRGYYLALVNEGFPEPEALMLTLAWQTSVMEQVKS